MLEVYAYNAGKGDCIRIRFSESHNILIDTGVMRFAPSFKRICDQIQSCGETLDALILTHADDDHIGGILANLRLSNYICPFQEVWMNHSGGASTGDRDLSVRQNDEVYARLLQRGMKVLPMQKGDEKNVAEAKIKTVWPEKEAPYCDMHCSKDALLSHHSDYRCSLTELAQLPIKTRDMSQNNKQSIIFSFHYFGKNLLFTGDAWAEDVVKAVGSYDLIKLPHHGSVRNISDEYKDNIQSANFLICTDGVDHPDKQTVAKLEKWYGHINIYSPVAWWKNSFFLPGDTNHNIKYSQKEGLVAAW